MVAVKHIHDLVDKLSEVEQEALASFLERFSAEDDPVERAFMRASLLEPEDLSPEEEELLREAEADVAAGRVISHEEIRREFLEES
jgi:hypothetical protein